MKMMNCCRLGSRCLHRISTSLKPIKSRVWNAPEVIQLATRSVVRSSCRKKLVTLLRDNLDSLFDSMFCILTITSSKSQSKGLKLSRANSSTAVPQLDRLILQPGFTWIYGVQQLGNIEINILSLKHWNLLKKYRRCSGKSLPTQRNACCQPSTHQTLTELWNRRIDWCDMVRV